MMITKTLPAAAHSHHTPARSAAVTFSADPTDRVDFSDPGEWVPVVASGVAGVFPFLGSLFNANQIFDGDSIAERFAGLGGTVGSMVGLPLLVTSLGSGSPVGISLGALGIALGAGNLMYLEVKERNEAAARRDA